MYELVVEHFTRHHLFHENHHGSMVGHSTASALIQLLNMWLVDQSAAYNLVDHLRLLQKLEIYGFDELTVKWLNPTSTEGPSWFK